MEDDDLPTGSMETKKEGTAWAPIIFMLYIIIIARESKEELCSKFLNPQFLASSVRRWGEGSGTPQGVLVWDFQSRILSKLFRRYN